jgi:hypothetical protein
MLLLAIVVGVGVLLMILAFALRSPRASLRGEARRTDTSDGLIPVLMGGSDGTDCASTDAGCDGGNGGGE